MPSAISTMGMNPAGSKPLMTTKTTEAPPARAEARRPSRGPAMNALGASHTKSAE